MSATLDQARAAKSKALGMLKGIRTVRGVGIAKSGDNYVLKVNLQRSPKGKTVLPAEVDGVPVALEVVGDVRKLPAKKG